MSNATAVNLASSSADRPVPASEQLALALPLAAVVNPARLAPQLRVSARTRTIGRAGIAEARSILAAQRERRHSAAA